MCAACLSQRPRNIGVLVPCHQSVSVGVRPADASLTIRAYSFIINRMTMSYSQS